MKRINLSEAQKKMLFIIGAVFLIASVGGGLYGFSAGDSFSYAAYIKALLLGSLLSAANVFILGGTVDKVIDMEGKAAPFYFMGNFLLRFLLAGTVLVVSAITPSLNLWGAVIGVLSFNLSAHLAKLFIKESR